jgi:ATP-dependent Clp protease ATP-binding subunit ClpC
MSSKFTQKAEIALNKSVNIAEEFGHTYIGTEHVLIAISEDENSCASVIMKKCGLTHEILCDAVKKHSGIGKRTRLTSKETTPRCRKILENSYKNAKKFSAEKIGTEHLLLAILEERDSVALKIISKLGISHSSLKEDTLLFLRSSERAMQGKKSNADISLPYLKKYAKNMTKAAIDIGYDPVIGREGEIDRLIRILSRRNKNNPCLVGEAGVGKTAVVEGLAQRIADGDAPIFLRGKSIYSIDFTAMVAGAKYRGDFEERIKGLIDEARGNKDIILFIDEIHTIVGAGSAEGAIDAANIMKPELARGDIRVIGATTASEYKKYIEKDSALERRFQPIFVEEPSRDKAVEILLGLKERYEEHHNVIIDNTAIEASVDLSMRYINDRFLPDKAIDLLDEACAKEALLSSDNIQEKTRYCYNKLKQLYGDDFMFDEDFDDDIIEMDTSIHNKIIEDLRCEYILRPKITSKNIIDVIRDVIGVDTFNASDDLSYDSIVNALESKIIGQRRAVQALADSILRCSCGISSTAKPKGIFLFVGGSGVGKTALAKECAKMLFKSDESLIRLDMSEYSESYSTSKLIGSAPGYVGYDERLSVLEKIRRHPYSILLLDEIEKAHPDVIALFLQIFDYGFIKDSSGRIISFRNTYIIMTSNVGADIRRGNIGFFSETASDGIENELKKYFKVEFINRIDEIIQFNQLSMNDLAKITSIKINDVIERLKSFPIDCSVDKSVINHIAHYTMLKGLGARPIDRIIAKDIEAPIARLLLEKNQPCVWRTRFDVQDGKITLTKSCPQLQS